MKRLMCVVSVFALLLGGLAPIADAGCGGLFGGGGSCASASYSSATYSSGGGGGLFAGAKARREARRQSHSFAVLPSTASFSQTTTYSSYASPIYSAPCPAGQCGLTQMNCANGQCTIPVQATPPPPPKAAPQSAITPTIVPVASTDYKLWADPVPREQASETMIATLY